MGYARSRGMLIAKLDELEAPKQPMIKNSDSIHNIWDETTEASSFKDVGFINNDHKEIYKGMYKKLEPVALSIIWSEMSTVPRLLVSSSYVRGSSCSRMSIR